jgi:hypothetical protein
MHERTINVGVTQSYDFEPGNAGSFWMTEDERETDHYNQILPPLPGNP